MDVRVLISENYEEIIGLADRFYENKNYGGAYEYYIKALALNGNDYRAYFGKSMCLGYLSEGITHLADISKGLRTAFSLCGEEDKKMIAGEIQKLVYHKMVFKTESFHNRTQCNIFAEKVLEQVRFMDAMYYFLEEADSDKKINYAKSVLSQCDSVGKLMKYTIPLFLPGKRIVLFCKVPDSIVNEMEIIRLKFAKIVSPAVNKSKANLDLSAAKLTALPIKTKVTHFMYSPLSFFITVILFFVNPVAGAVFLSFQAVSVLLFMFVFDKDKSARAMYKETAELKKIYRQNKKGMK